MRHNILILCLVVGLAFLVHSQDMVDFTYSKYVQNNNVKGNNRNQVSIHPNTQTIGGFNFPEACLMAKKINQNVAQDHTELQNLDSDTIVDDLKKQFVQLLRVSEKIKKKKSNIAELAKLSNVNTNAASMYTKDIELLKKYEDNLAQLNDQIKTKSQHLETLVYDSIKNSENNDFVMSALDYEIQFLGLKLEYLQKQQKQSALAESSSSSDAFGKYFKDLKNKFDEENDLVNDLNKIIENYNQIGILKSKINRLKGQIEISDLMLEEKQICARERDQIRKFQRNQGEIKALMTNLREKKKDKSNINNMYCEGVVKKLEDRVKKVLMTYDYTFECAQGLEQLRNKRNNYQNQLTEAFNRLKVLQDNIGIDDYRVKFEENRRYIQAKNQEINTFSMPAYHHNINDLSSLIEKTQNQLDQVKEKRSQMKKPVEKKNTDFKAIHQLVNQIKSLKGKYCFDYSRYEARAQEIWGKVYQMEGQLNYHQKVQALYTQQINELRGLEMVFNDLRHHISSRIK